MTVDTVVDYRSPVTRYNNLPWLTPQQDDGVVKSALYNYYYVGRYLSFDNTAAGSKHYNVVLLMHVVHE